MRKDAESIQRHNLWHSLSLMLVMLALLLPSVAGADFTIKVGGKDYSNPANPVFRPMTTSFKWMVQKDTSYDGVGHVGFHNISSISQSIHKSYAPPVAAGDNHNTAVKLPSGRYFVSVMAPGHTLSGTTVRPGQTTAEVTLIKYPVPLAQINVLVHVDDFPLNGTPDLNTERALPTFKVLLIDQLGRQTMDAFGNPLGTLYDSDANGRPILDAGGNPTVVQMGPGYVLTGPTGDIVTGNAIIPNVAPGKYGVRAVPQDGKPWVQTSTIEGTPGVDVWIKAGEPRNFIEAGTFAVHVFLGFVLPSSYTLTADPNDPHQFRPLDPVLFPGDAAGYGSIVGQVVKNHANRPPSVVAGINPWDPVDGAFVSLTEITTNKTVYVAPCNPDGTFQILNVPPDTYTMTIWDLNLDQIIDFRTVFVAGGATPTDIGQAVVPSWFGTLKGYFFNDANGNAVFDPGEQGLSDKVINIRFRDGTIYQTTVTRPDGGYEFTEVFPFIKWLVLDSDYTNLKPTGLTSYVDKGGPIDPAFPGPLFPDTTPSVPLLETVTSSLASTPGSVGADFLLQGMKLEVESQNRVDWGRIAYAPGENGGIVGIVFSDTTRAADDPALELGEPWDPAIPGVTVNLYRVIGYEPRGNSYFPVAEKTPLATTVSDSWEKSFPTGCRDTLAAAGIGPVLSPGGYDLNKHLDCAEILPYWNQLKPTVFDGGYAFTDYFDPSTGETKPLPAGDYIVEVILPHVYELQKEEDKNVEFGDVFKPSFPQPKPALLPAPCVGADHVVPQFRSLSFLTPNDPVPATYAGQTRPLCDRKLVTLRDGQNAAADFHLFTMVPEAARYVGLVTDDLRTDTRNGAPSYGDKLGLSFVPISIQDFNGNEMVRTYTDEFGVFDVLVPGTFTINPPIPTGVSPGVYQVSLNHPGFDPLNPDPWFKRGYPSAAANSWDAWPGKTTYLDIPLVPISPNAGNVDCNQPDAKPVIVKVTNTTGGGDLGPWIESTAAPATLEITSLGTKSVPNVEHLLNSFTRSYGFGDSPGTVELVNASGTKIPLDKAKVIWTDATIKVEVPAGTAAGEYQLVVVRKDSGQQAESSITVHVGVPAAKVRKVPSTYPTVQAAIDAAQNGDLILVAPGTYAENLIIWKPLKLQGYGSLSTIINAGFFTPEQQVLWTAKLNGIIGPVPVNSPFLIHSDPAGANPTVQDPTFAADFGPAILVLAPDQAIPNLNGQPINVFDNGANQARIDGVQITQARLGGGILVNANAHYMKITNNQIIANQGNYGGGIRLGQPSLVDPDTTLPTGYLSAHNDHVEISRNEIIGNGAIGQVLGAGGGIGIFNGADNYSVNNSWICGNFALLAGAGIAHQGISTNSLIQDNKILFNESFDEGGGVFIGGELARNTDVPLSPGAGNVTVNRNLFQGNKSKDLGGALALFSSNGLDVFQNNTNTPPTPPATTPAVWFKAEIFNNIIVNNLTGGYGAGIALFDAVGAEIVNNTIARNDTTATSELGLFNPPATPPFPLPPGALALPMPAGIGLQPTSAGMLAQIDISIRPGYSGPVLVSPLLVNDIIYQNRSFYYDGSVNPPRFPNANTYWDLGLFGQPPVGFTPAPTVRLDPTYSLLSDTTGYATSNITGDPFFIAPYFNTITTTQGAQILGTEFLFDYTPLTTGVSSYLIQNGSAAIDKGTATLPVDTAATTLLQTDYNLDSRTATPDVGADEASDKGKAPGSTGPISVVDALLALEAIGRGPTAQEIASFDVWPLGPNGKPAGDGKLTIEDALLILKRAVGLVTW